MQTSPWFFMLAQYGQKAGNPYYDTPDFEGYEAVHLRVVPVQMGFRWDLIRGKRFKFNFGLAFETVWAEEEIPALSETELANTRTSNGWSHGFQITLGPEWRFRDGVHALGLDIGYGESGGDLGKGRSKHDLNLTGYNARIYYAIQP